MEEPKEPFAPHPVSLAPTELKLGSWFQKREKVAQALGVVAAVAGLNYLTWRVLWTSNQSWWTFAPFFAAEIFGYLSFLIFLLDSWKVEPTPRRTPLNLSVDIVIPTFNEDVDILEPTIVGALAVRGDTKVWLLDDNRRSEIKALAKRYGIEYRDRPNNDFAKAGNINASLPFFKGELLLILDADHVPAPDFLQATTGYFADSNVALVQTAHSFRNLNSVSHDPRDFKSGRNDQSLFFDVLLPGRNRIKSVLWCGSAALIKREILVELGGLSTYSIIEDFETSLVMRQHGYAVLYHNEHLIQGLAADNLQAHVIQRNRWAQGLFMIFRPSKRLAMKKELGILERLSYFGGLLYYLTPIQRLIYSFTLIFVALFSWYPVSYVGLWYFAFWAPFIILNLLSVSALERGTTYPFEGTRNMYITMEAYLRALKGLWSRQGSKFIVTPKGEVDLGGWKAVKVLRFPLAISILTAFSLVFAWINYLLQTSNALNLPTLIIITAFGGVETFIAIRLTRDVYNRRQFRHLWRFPVRLETYVNGDFATCVDLHQHGAGIITNRSTIKDDIKLKVRISVSDVDGSRSWASGKLTVMNIRPLDSKNESIRVGGAITWDSEKDRSKVIKHCYVVEQYVARQRFWLRNEQRFVVLLDSLINGKRKSECIDASFNGASFLLSNEDWNSIKDKQNIDVLVAGKFKGRGEVRNVRAHEGKVRLGVSMVWEETGWIQQIISELHGDKRRKLRSRSLVQSQSGI